MRDWKVSYEGEGPLLGLKTLFFRFGAGDSLPTLPVSLDTVAAVYCNLDRSVSKVPITLLRWLVDIEVSATIEIELDETLFLPVVPGVQYFVSVRKFVTLLPFPGFIKIRVLEGDRLEDKVELANQYAAAHHSVLLMPEVDLSTIGHRMVEFLPVLNPRVRFMPPVQMLLGID